MHVTFVTRSIHGVGGSRGGVVEEKLDLFDSTFAFPVINHASFFVVRAFDGDITISFVITVVEGSNFFGDDFVSIVEGEKSDLLSWFEGQRREANAFFFVTFHLFDDFVEVFGSVFGGVFGGHGFLSFGLGASGCFVPMKYYTPS